MKKFLLSFLCFLLAVGGYAEEYSYTFTSKQFSANGTKTLNGVEWTLDGDGGYWDYDETKGQHLGSNKKPYKSMTLSTSGIEGTITKIVINTSGGSSVNASLTVSVGGTEYGNKKLTATATNYTFEPQAASSGEIKFAYTQTSSKGLYIKSIAITYEKGTVQETVATPVISPASKEFNKGETVNVSITTETEGATIRYTINGDTPTVESAVYSAPFAVNSTTTIKAIAVKDGCENSEVATATYTRVAALPKINYVGNASSFENSITVRVDTDNDAVAYYTLNGEQPTKESTQYVESLTIKADATLKVVACEEGEYVSPVVEQVFKMKNDGVQTNTATLVTNAANLAVGDKVVIVASGSDMALSTEQKNNNRGVIGVTKSGNDVVLKAGETSDVQRLTLEKGTVDGTYAFYTGSGYLYAASSSYNYLRTQTTNDDNGSWKIDIAATTGVATIKAQGKYENNWLRYNSSSNPNLFSCYGPNNTQKDVSLYKVIKDYVLNVTEAGWATLYFDYAVTIPEGVICYVVSGVGEESVQLTEVTGVLPANTAVIVNANKGGYTFEGTEKTAAVESIMDGSVENKYIAEEAYVLGMVDGEIGLYKAEMMGGVFLNNANKAYLPASPAVQSNAKVLKFNFDTTGVEGVKVETAGKKVIYDLSGRRVNDMTAPGLYIVNGKKVMVK